MTQTTNDRASGWDELRRLVDELQLQIHLGSMDARNRWQALQPRLAEVQQAIASSGRQLDALLDDKITKLGTALRKLRDELAPPRT